MPEKLPTREAEKLEVGLDTLSPKGQKKILDALVVERAIYKRPDGSMGKEYLDLERKLIEATIDKEAKEWKLMQKLSATLSYLGSKMPDVSSRLPNMPIPKLGLPKITSRRVFAIALALTAFGLENHPLEVSSAKTKTEDADMAATGSYNGLAYREEFKKIRDHNPVKHLEGEIPKIEKLRGLLSTEVMQDILKETLPHGCLDSISSIEYLDKDIKMPSRYGSNVGGDELAHLGRVQGRIILAKPCGDQFNETVVDEIITHEVGHGNDWISNTHLTREQRIEIMESVMSRIASPDRYKSDYVETITNINETKRDSLKAEEYFAEIFSAYLSTKYDTLPETDRAIISGLIKKLDSIFDREKALQKRQELLGQIKEDRWTKIGSQIKKFLHIG